MQGTNIKMMPSPCQLLDMCTRASTAATGVKMVPYPASCWECTQELPQLLLVSKLHPLPDSSCTLWLGNRERKCTIYSLDYVGTLSPLGLQVRLRENVFCQSLSPSMTSVIFTSPKAGGNAFHYLGISQVINIKLTVLCRLFYLD